MIVLDTKVISEIMKSDPNPTVKEWMQHNGAAVATSAITVSELLAGLARMPGGKKKNRLMIAVQDVLQTMRVQGRILAFDDSAAVYYADVLKRRNAMGAPISTPDAQIAAICRSNGLPLVTWNTKDFVGAGVELINLWTNE